MTGVPGAKAAANEALADFVAAQGCAIGPATRILAGNVGLDAAAIDALAAQAEGEEGTVRTGDWIVLPPSLCSIRPPEVRSEIRLSDPEVKALTSRIDAYAESGDRGCFIDGLTIMERVQETRGWDADKANQEYLRFLAENLRSGDLAFYKNDPLSTPVGFQVLTGDCADVPEIDAIQHSQVLRDREFDNLIRADAANVVCGQDDAPSYNFMNLAQERTGGENTNAWMFFEVRTMAMGGGWYFGNSATQKGAPRPPLCRFE